MRYLAVTSVFALLAGSTVVKADPPVKETGVVSWQYFIEKSAVGDPIPPAGSKTNIRCSVISSDGEGDWVCLYVDAVAKTNLPDTKGADSCRPVTKDGKPFKLTNAALFPDSDTTQLVPFVSSRTETAYKLTVKKDGTIAFELIGPTFHGETSMSGAASMCWYVSKKK